MIESHVPAMNSAGRPRAWPIIDSQGVKTTDAGGPRGYDAGKKINGSKRYAPVDTDGLGLGPHPASIHNRDGGLPLLRDVFPFIKRSFAGYAGEKVARATLIAVERFFARIGRNSALSKRLRGDRRHRARLPLCHIRYAACASDRTCFMTFETDFEGDMPSDSRGTRQNVETLRG